MSNAVTSAMSLLDQPQSVEEFEPAVLKYLEFLMQPVPLFDLNRRFGVLSHRMMGQPLKEVLKRMERQGKIATHFNIKRRKMYVYDVEMWKAMNQIATANMDYEYIERNENEVDPPIKRPSGAQRRKMEKGRK